MLKTQMVFGSFPFVLVLGNVDVFQLGCLLKLPITTWDGYPDFPRSPSEGFCFVTKQSTPVIAEEPKHPRSSAVWIKRI